MANFICYLGPFELDRYIRIIASRKLEYNVVDIFSSGKSVEQLYLECIDKLLMEYDIQSLYVCNLNVYNLFQFDGISYKISKFKRVDNILLESIRSKILNRDIIIDNNPQVVRRIKSGIKDLYKNMRDNN